MNEKKCPSCGASINLNATECKYCGEAIALQTTQYQAPQPQNGPSQEQQSQNVYAYLKPYYQEEFQKISASNGTYKGKFNWCAFFFTWIWAFTKGLWGLALASLAIGILISSISSELAFLSIGIWIFCGVRGNYFYYNLLTNKKQFP
jgi:hypothetical protein